MQGQMQSQYKRPFDTDPFYTGHSQQSNGGHSPISSGKFTSNFKNDKK